MEAQMQQLLQQVQQLTSPIGELNQRQQQDQVQHASQLAERDVTIAEMRGALQVLQTSPQRERRNQSELLDPKILHKVQPFNGERSPWKTFEFQWKRI